LGTTGKVWLAVLAVFTGWVLVLLVSPTARRATDQADAAVLRRVAEVRTAWLTDIATAFDRIATGWTLTALAVGVLVLQIAFRRWRHLFTFLASILVMELIGISIYNAFSRPRPYDVTAIGRWAGFSSPSPPVVVFAAVLVAVIYSLVPAGAARGRAKLVVAAVLLAFISARLYLGVDHPFDVLAGLALGIAIPLAGFRLFTPNDVVPVAYRQGKTAHLDVTGRRLTLNPASSRRRTTNAVDTRVAVIRQHPSTVEIDVPVFLAGQPLGWAQLDTGSPQTYIHAWWKPLLNQHGRKLYVKEQQSWTGRRDSVEYWSVHGLAFLDPIATNDTATVEVGTIVPDAVIGLDLLRQGVLRCNLDALSCSFARRARPSARPAPPNER